MPFVTEECRQQLKTGGDTIMLQAYPVLSQEKISPEIEQAMLYIQELTTAIRNIRSEANVSPAKDITALIKSVDKKELEIIEKNKMFIMKLAKIEHLEFGKEVTKPDLTGFRVS
jgi:valyl-tRNA synthetase